PYLNFLLRFLGAHFADSATIQPEFLDLMFTRKNYPFLHMLTIEEDVLIEPSCQLQMEGSKGARRAHTTRVKLIPRKIIQVTGTDDKSMATIHIYLPFNGTRIVVWDHCPECLELQASSSS
ncbi:MAG: hypothetical protein AAGD25_39190, partial [Cyanobacteria bacterium P01_F01_bin.150]